MNVAGEVLYSDKETATMLGVVEKTLPMWRHLGRGPTYLKIGRRVFYRPTDIKEWLDKQVVRPAKTAAA